MNSTNSNQDKQISSQPELTIETLLRRAHAGDISVLPNLRSLLQEPAILNLFGNLAYRVECDIIDRLAGPDLALQEGLKLKLQIMREELAGPEASALERQLVERIALCWLSLHEAEYRFANAGESVLVQRELEEGGG